MSLMTGQFGDSTLIKIAKSVPKAVLVIFTVEPPAQMTGIDESRARSVIVEIPDDAQTGIASLVIGAHSLIVPRIYGGSGVAYSPIAELLDHTGGLWRARVFYDRGS